MACLILEGRHCSRVAFRRQLHLAVWDHISWLYNQKYGEEGRRSCGDTTRCLQSILLLQCPILFSFSSSLSGVSHFRVVIDWTSETYCLWWGEKVLYTIAAMQICYANLKHHYIIHYIYCGGRGKGWVAKKLCITAETKSKMKSVMKIGSLNLIGVKII